jgi:membrane protease YdiL (CAAX protease family)
MTKQNKIKIMVIYLIAFFSLWALAELVIFERINIFVENEILSCFIEDAIIKMLVWTLPAAIMIHYFKDAVYITLKEMFLSKVNWFQYLPIFIFFTLYILSGAILQNGNLVVSSEFGFDDVVGLLFVGITEELVFRGWLLNLTVNEGKKWLPISINAIMFLAIHFPIWIRQGVFISSFTSLGFLCILILSIIFSCTFIKSRNILVPVVLHMYWDLLVSLFF